MTYQYLIRLYIDFKLIAVASEVWGVIGLEKYFEEDWSTKLMSRQGLLYPKTHAALPT